LNDRSSRVEELLAGFDRPIPPGQARARAEELVRLLVALYGEALERILTIVHDENEAGADRVFARLGVDPIVSHILAIHGLHPLTTLERAERALDAVRPYVESHQGHVEVAGIDGSVAVVRMSGSCHGCPSSSITLKLAVERAILEQCPELSSVRTEGAEQPAMPSSLQLTSDWIEIDRIAGLDSAGFANVDVSGVPVLVVRAGALLYAYRNCCPVCLRAINEPRLEGAVLSCTSCGSRFDVVLAGRSADGHGAALEAYPLLIKDGRLRLSVPIPA
jgi:Fe-S cluster biogenesis protein NfuA/nitrite reductase/ring-hydroxylating ferredoxin subunit